MVIDDEQDTNITSLTDEIADCKEKFLGDLDQNINNLNSRGSEARQKLFKLSDHIHTRKCE